MLVRYELHPRALAEFEESTQYYLDQASGEVAEAFAAAVHTALADICVMPTRWPLKDRRGIRGCRLHRFPFTIIYYHNERADLIWVFAIAHSKRDQNYWRERIFD